MHFIDKLWFVILFHIVFTFCFCFWDLNIVLWLLKSFPLIHCPSYLVPKKDQRKWKSIVGVSVTIKGKFPWIGKRIWASSTYREILMKNSFYYTNLDLCLILILPTMRMTNSQFAPHIVPFKIFSQLVTTRRCNHNKKKKKKFHLLPFSGVHNDYGRYNHNSKTFLLFHLFLITTKRWGIRKCSHK